MEYGKNEGNGYFIKSCAMEGDTDKVTFDHKPEGMKEVICQRKMVQAERKVQGF